jgi:hypothetical protein
MPTGTIWAAITCWAKRVRLSMLQRPALSTMSPDASGMDSEHSAGNLSTPDRGLPSLR